MLLLLVVAGCSDAESTQTRSAPTTAPASVTVMTVKRQHAQRTVDVVGTLFGDEETTISAKVSGRIVAIHHDVGDRVQPGQPLAQIEKRDYELARSQKQLAVRESLAGLGLSALPSGDFNADAIPTVVKARLAAENAEGRYQRGKQLHDQTPPRLSDQEFSDLQTAWEVARNEHQVQILQAQATLAEARARQAELEMAEQQLADTTVRAPMEAPDATNSPSSTQSASTREYAVAERLVSVGEFVSNGTALFRLVDDDPIKLRAYVPERFAGQIQVGQSVRIWIEAFEQPFTGAVTRINPQIDPTNRNFRIEAIFENPDGLLKPGAFARASIQTRVEPDVIFVPASAVVTFAGVHRVFVSEDGTASERVVELGDRRGDEIEIRGGLMGDETLVVTGAANLSPGTPLRFEDR